MGNGTALQRMLIGLTATVALLGAPPALAAPAPPTPVAPTVNTGGAKSTTATSATLTGTVNPEGQATTYRFEYGTSPQFGSMTPSASAGSGTTNVAVQATISSLTPNTTYHYRLVATNASGTTTGSDKTFKTAKGPSVTISPSPSTITFGQSTTLKGTGPANATITLQRAASASGPFVNAGTTTTSNNGKYSFTEAPTSNTFYRAISGGATSTTTRVLVRFRISLFVSDTTPRHGQLVRFSGRVSPRNNSLRVRIQRLTKSGFWHTVRRTFLHSAGGNASAYAVRFRVRHGGLYRATVGPDATHARGFSRDIRIQLH